MNESKHTPGPWTAFSDEINDHTNILSIADRTRFVLSLPGRHKSEPDIRLITAAPDLLEALEKAVTGYGNKGGPWSVPSEPGAWIEMAKNAIAKARGEQS